MLYPTTVAPSPEYQNFYIVPNGNLYVFPFTLGAGETFDIDVTHMAGTSNQDHSLRIWVSRTVGDGPVTEHPRHTSFWHANRPPNAEIVTVYDSSLPVPDRTAPLGLAPGDYFIHVLNLSNLENAFTYALTEIV